MTADLLLTHVNLATCDNPDVPFGALPNSCLAVKDGIIVSIGEPIPAHQVFDAGGAWLTPGLIDCHTHLLFAGDRAEEFDARLRGVSYTEIAQRGGGIRSTMNATRAASEETLVKLGRERLQRLLQEGVTTVEIKSGYGLDLANECKLLNVATTLSAQGPQTISRTFLGAHALPPEFNDKDAFIEHIIGQMLPTVVAQQLADALDVFCEGIGFSPAQSERLFQAAKAIGLPIKAHVEQLSDLAGARLAASYGALSVDHLEYLSEQDVVSLREAGTVAVLLPGAFYYLRENQLPPVAALRQHNVPMAVASDYNPGTSPILSLLTNMNMAAVLFSLTPDEVLRGVTANAARALGLSQKGRLAPGMDADMVLWPIQHPAQLVAGIQQVSPSKVWIAGKEVLYG